MAVASIIAVGTSKGLILIFDHQQNLKATIGVGTRATESGPVTAVALSADFSTVAGGHANGSIFTWEIAKPAKPFISLSCTSAAHLESAKADGHVQDVAILHLGFLGTRHTALVSADDKGMAFSHLASRGLGAIARSVRTTRILGRYPETGPMPVRSRKPSSVLAFAPLPLGNVETAIESLGIVAMLTPYLLVVVSTTPVAQTQHKASRPKELAAHGALTAAVAWYPAMKVGNKPLSAKLAYCWLNFVTILEVEEVEVDEDAAKERPVDLRFRTQKKWQAEESVVAMQWLNRSVLAILTVSQQLVILEDEELTVTDSSDLINKHVFHSDHFSQQLGQMIESLDEENTSMHGVVADAFYMSFRAYKGRLFLLGFNDVFVGTLSNWADRLFAMMEQGDFIGAIQLATSYYAGGADKASIGLPLDDSSRHALVGDKLTELMAASLRYAFGRNPDADSIRASDSQLEHLARACFVSCLLLQGLEFLFEEAYTWYTENGLQGQFLRILEEFISDGQVRTLPPVVLKDLVNDFASSGRSTRLEEILCLLDPTTMDLDQVTSLCKKFKLQDALFYVWAQAIGDYVTVLKDLLDSPQENGKEEEHESNGFFDFHREFESSIFTYLSYTLTDRIYPTGDVLPSDTALKAKADIYHLLFSGSSPTGQTLSSFHYLRKILDLDTASFMSMLNEAFEDTFLDESLDGTERSEFLTEEQRFGASLTRQFVIQILLKFLVPPEYQPTEIVYLDMFIARNQAKFSQFIRLPGSVLQRVLLNLCNYPDEDVAEDCQLSLEYLLTVYHPPDVSALLPLLKDAKFFRILKSVYRSRGQLPALLQTCFDDDENPDGMYEGIRECFSPNHRPSEDLLDQLRRVILSNSTKLLSANLKEAATAINQSVPELHEVLIQSLEMDEHAQYIYLHEILENNGQSEETPEIKQPYKRFFEIYVKLLCEYDPHHVSSFVDRLASGDLRLKEVLPAMETSGAIDAAVTLMAREGQTRQAMDRLLEHLSYLEIALLSLIGGSKVAPDSANIRDNAEDLLESLEKYNKIGLWLCRGQTYARDMAASAVVASSQSLPTMHSRGLDGELSGYEVLWLDLIDSSVRISRSADEFIDGILHTNHGKATQSEAVSQADLGFVLSRLRAIVQTHFTALLTATSVRGNSDQSNSNLAFLRILRAFLGRISKSSRSLVQLRNVLGTLFSAYAYEENLLSLANSLLDKDLFVRIDEVSARRKRGWRPSSQVCNSCGLKVWGPGVGAKVWDSWYEKQESRESQDAAAVQAGSSKLLRSGKGKDTANTKSELTTATSANDTFSKSSNGDRSATLATAGDTLIVFSCRHVFHAGCLEGASSKDPGTASGLVPERFSAYRCPLEQPSVGLEPS